MQKQWWCEMTKNWNNKQHQKHLNRQKAKEDFGLGNYPRNYLREGRKYSIDSVYGVYVVDVVQRLKERQQRTYIYKCNIEKLIQPNNNKFYWQGDRFKTGTDIVIPHNDLCWIKPICISEVDYIKLLLIMDLINEKV